MKKSTYHRGNGADGFVLIECKSIPFFETLEFFANFNMGFGGFDQFKPESVSFSFSLLLQPVVDESPVIVPV